MSGHSFSLALAQMLVVPGEKAKNLARATAAIRSAAEAGNSIVLLPEALDLGWTDPSAKELADPIPEGESLQTLRAAAVASQIHVCAGIVERDGNRIYNSAVLIDPKGQLLAHHRKINELAFAHALYSPGDRLLVAETTLGKIGLMICADAFIPGRVISRSLAAMGAEIILSPSAWAVPPGHDNAAEPYGQLWLDHYHAVALEYGIWVAGASCVGPVLHGNWAGWNCIGCSLVIDPDGKPVLKGPYGPTAETLLSTEITPRPARRPDGETGS